MSDNIRTIIHIDMDAFFASVEQKANPKLKGLPVAVCGKGKRGVIVTSSYEAREMGIETGMTPNMAKRLCPEVILVPADIEKYIYTSAKLISIFEEFTPVVEPYSIDEAFLDVTGSLKYFGGIENIINGLKKRIGSELGITASIGVAPNKLLAKLASGMNKPDGVFIINQGDIKDILRKTPVGKLCGIGKKMEAYLRDMGVRTIADLGSLSVPELKRRFGIIAQKLHLMGIGDDPSPVIQRGKETDAKSIGHSLTLERDILSVSEIRGILFTLSEMVGRRLRRDGFRGRTVTLTLRYSDFYTFSRRKTISTYIYSSDDIFKVSFGIFSSIRYIKPVRLLGVAISNLVKTPVSLPLFEWMRKKENLTKAIDEINNRYGDFTISSAEVIPEIHKPHIIPPKPFRMHDRNF